MNAVISGTVGRALLIDGKSLKSFDADDPSKLVDRQQSDLLYLFGEGRDLRIIENSDITSIAAELKFESNSALALDLTLISLDDELEADIREDALRDLDELLVESQLVVRLENILYARSLPDDGDLVGALELCTDGLANALSLLQGLQERQSVIAEVSAAWDIIPTKVFGSPDNQSEFQHVAVREGLFRALVLALAESDPIRGDTLQTNIQGKLYKFFLDAGLNPSIRNLRNQRQVLQDWTNSFRHRGDAVTIKHEFEEEERETAPRRRRGRRIDIDRQAVLGEVNRRKAIITGAIHHRDFGIVRELVEDLVGFQRTTGENKHLAKSLCDLAMDAKELGAFSLQLELTERSIGIAADDGWSWAQHADALLNMNRLDDALHAYEQAGAFGESVIAKSGLANVLKTKGELDAALAAYNEVIAQHPENVVARSGRAEVLKSQGQFDAALTAFDEVISQHPEDVFARTGRAEVLKAKGELGAALTAYERIINDRPENRVARTGLVSILAATGRYGEALEYLSEKQPLTLDDWIDSHILGMIRLRTGKMSEAIRIFDERLRNNPSPSSREYFSRALALAWLRSREFQKASQALDQVKSLPLQPTANVLRIHAFGAQGNVQRATIAYESLSIAPHLRSGDLTQELRHQFILRKPPRRNEQWIVDREAQIVLLAA